MRNTFIKTLTELAEHNPSIFVLTADLGWGVFETFEAKFPDRYINVGVAEQNMMGLATGLALEGYHVFTYSIGNFPTFRPLEQIRNDICYHNAKVTIVSVGGGFTYGGLGFSHHCTEDIAIMSALPNMTVLVPGDQFEVVEVTKIAAQKSSGPCYLRLDKAFAETKEYLSPAFTLGKARVLREGKAFTIMACGGIMQHALDAAKILAGEGIEVRVLSVPTVKPLDVDAVLSAANDTGGIITIEEHSIHGGLAAAVSQVCMDHAQMPKAFHAIALRQGFTTVVGSQEYLREHYGIHKNVIVKKVKALLGRAS